MNSGTAVSPRSMDCSSASTSKAGHGAFDGGMGRPSFEEILDPQTFDILDWWVDLGTRNCGFSSLSLWV